MILVVVVVTHFAIVAINAAVRFGLHEQYYDYLFRYQSTVDSFGTGTGRGGALT